MNPHHPPRHCCELLKGTVSAVHIILVCPVQVCPFLPADTPVSSLKGSWDWSVVRGHHTAVSSVGHKCALFALALQILNDTFTIHMAIVCSIFSECQDNYKTHLLSPLDAVASLYNPPQPGQPIWINQPPCGCM